MTRFISDPKCLSGKNLLLITHVRFWDNAAGSCPRIRYLTRSLKGYGIKCHLVFDGHLSKEEETKIKIMGLDTITTGSQFSTTTTDLTRDFTSKLYRFFNKYTVRLINVFSKYFSKNSNITGKKVIDFRDTRMLKAVSWAYIKYSPEIVLVEYIRLAYVLEVINNNAVKIIDTHDIMYLRQKAFESYGERHFIQISKEEETEVLSKFDIILAIQEKDTKILREMLPDHSVVTCLPVVEHRKNPEVKSTYKASSKQILCVCAANRVNYLGLSAFIDFAWPLILNRNPDTDLIICGKIGDYFKGTGFRNVYFKGYVDDLSKYYARANLVINPVQFGGGIKIKSVEALAHGKASVLSRHATLGIESGEGSAFVVAETWEEFAFHINELLNDNRRKEKLEKEALIFYQQYFLEKNPLSELVETLIPMLCL